MASDHRSQDTPPREWTGPGTVWVGHHEPGLALVTPRGEHDLSTVRVLRPACEKPTAHSNVLVDLSHCTFYRLEIISTLLSAAHTVTQRNEQLVLVTHRSSDWSHAAQP